MPPSTAIDELKETFREIMLHILACEDEIILDLNDPELRRKVREHFERLRSSLAKVYVKRLREGYEREFKAFTERLELEFLPSKLIPKPPRGQDLLKAWIDQIARLLEDYEGELKELRKRAAERASRQGKG